MIGTDAQKFGRMMTAMVTPFDDEQKVDFSAVERLVEHLIATGTETIVVCGTTGESPTLEEKEKQDLLRSVISVNNGRVKVIMGTGSNDTRKSIKASREAEEIGADGLLLVAPYYNKPSQDGLTAHFQAIAECTGLPIIVYNIPGRTGITIAVDTILKLIDSCPNIYAVKDSTGNVDLAAEIGSRAGAAFRVYSGDDYLTLPYLSVGACGVVSVASHIIGKQIQEMIAAFFDGDVERARQLHYQWSPLFKGLFASPNPTCVKYALSALGLCKPYLRLPLVELNDAQKQAMNLLLKEACPKAVTA